MKLSTSPLTLGKIFAEKMKREKKEKYHYHLPIWYKYKATLIIALTAISWFSSCVKGKKKKVTQLDQLNREKTANAWAIT